MAMVLTTSNYMSDKMISGVLSQSMLITIIEAVESRKERNKCSSVCTGIGRNFNKQSTTGSLKLNTFKMYT
jgi:hypothetical protein